MDDNRNKKKRPKRTGEQDEEFPVTSTQDESLTALLLPFQRDTPHSGRSTLCSEGAGFETESFFGELPHLAYKLRPLFQACGISSRDAEWRRRVFSTSAGPLPSRDIVSKQIEAAFQTYPCIAGDIDSVVRSLTTVLDDMNHGQNTARFLRPSANSTGPRMMDATKLTQCLSCDLCLRRLRNPCTSLICLHSFCYACIKQAVKGEAGEKMCPVPGCGCMTTEGFQPTAFGKFPLQGKHQCIVKDATLSTLIKKLFGSETMNDAKDEPDQDDLLPNYDLPSVWIDEIGPLRRIQAKQALQTPAPVAESDIHSSLAAMQKKNQNSSEYITVAVFPVDGGFIDELDDNYFYAPGCMTLCQFCLYLEHRFHFNQLELYCDNMPLSVGPFAEMTLIEAYDEFWLPYHDDPEDVFTLRYRHYTSPLSNTFP